MNTQWPSHFNQFNAVQHPPAGTLLKSLELFDLEKTKDGDYLAIDLGCGTGIDTRELLKRNWQVLAIDQQTEAIDQIVASVPRSQTCLLQTQQASFEQISTLPSCMLVNATFSLPFCQPAYFERFWETIIAAISVGGRFSGQFFGVHDSWHGQRPLTFHTVAAVHQLFNSFTIEYLREIDKTGKTIAGKDKHWHVFHVVARKH